MEFIPVAQRLSEFIDRCLRTLAGSDQGVMGCRFEWGDVEFNRSCVVESRADSTCWKLGESGGRAMEAMDGRLGIYSESDRTDF